MSKCIKCGKELPKDTQGTICQKCFWCDYKFNKKENELKQDEYKQDLIERSLKDKIAVYLADTFLTFNVEMSNFCFEKILNNYIDFEMEIEQLKKENEELKSENNEFCSYNKKIREENAKLKAELAEKDKLLENAIVQKFKIGDEVWIIKRIKQEVANGKIIKKYLYFNGGTPENLRNVNRWRIRLRNNSEVTKKEYELFYTRKEAEEALKKLEEK